MKDGKEAERKANQMKADKNEMIIKEFNELLPTEQISFLKKFDEMEKRAKVIRKSLTESGKEFLIRNNLTEEGYSQDGISINYKKAYTKKVVDTDAMKEQGIYDDFLKEAEVSDSVSITVEYDD